MTAFGAKMQRLFAPASVAVVGASDNPAKLGFHVMKSLNSGGFAGKVYPVNPGARTIGKMTAYPALSQIPGPVDLAVVVVPATLVPGVLTECAAADVGGIVLITAGFKEIDDPSGADLHTQIARIADTAGIPVIGPNTFGMINFHNDLNASFTPEFSLLRPGKIALVSQSGGMSHLIGFLSMTTGVTFSKIVGLGNRLNVDFAEMVAYLMADADTAVIALYMEGIDTPGPLIAALREHRGKKPVIAFKTGRSAKGDQAARSHTGSMAGRHAVYQGAFRQSGILTVTDTQALLDAAKALAGCPQPEEPGVAVLSGQAGPGMAACDVCEACGLTVCNFSAGTQQRINELLPPLALRTNPVDMGPAWYDAPATRAIIGAALDDANVSGLLLLVMFASANVDMIEGIADFLVQYHQKKPVISCILAPPGIWDDAVDRLERAGALVNYPTPERAAAAMAALWHCALGNRQPE